MGDKKNEYMTLDEFRIGRASRYVNSSDSVFEMIMSAWRRLTSWIRRGGSDEHKADN
jgi:hypothetical protein